MRLEQLHPKVRQFYQYLKYAGKSDRTAYVYVLRVNDFLNFIGKDPENITRDDIMSYYDHLYSTKRYSDRSIAAVGWALKAFFEMLGKRDLAMWIPTPSYSVVREPKWLPEDICMKVIDKVPVLVVAYDLALRVGEVPLLRRDRYNPKTGEIEVYRLKHKGRYNRQILQLDDWARDILNEYLESRKDNDPRIFPMTSRNIQYIFKRRLRLCGLDPKEYTFHVLRHSRLTHIAIKELRTKGYVDIVSLAKFAGHARPETTMMYVHLAHKYLSFVQNK